MSSLPGVPAPGGGARAARVLGDADRGRLDDLLAATDAELRRRGVLRLETPPEPQAPAEPDLPATPLSPLRRPGGGRPGLRALAAGLPVPPLPDRRELAARLPGLAAQAAGEAAVRVRDLTGRDVVDLELLGDVMAFAQRAAAVRRSHRDGRNPVDDFGFDEEWTEALLPLARLVYRRWWRVTTTGIENVPRRGGALLVSNHSGVLPFDGAMIKVAAFEEGLDRHIRALVATWFFGLPGLSWFLRRTGQTVGHPDDTHRLLSAGELVLVFPEGVKGTGKPFRERYRLRRFGRGGFAASAIRAGVPIVPVSVVGAEEIYPMLADVSPLARLAGMPYFPITPTWPWLGPLGLVPLPSRWRIQFHPPVRTDQMPAAAAEDASAVLHTGDRVRDVIQEGLITNVMERRTAFRD